MKIKKILAIVCAAALALTVLAFTPLLSSADQGDSRDISLTDLIDEYTNQSTENAGYDAYSYTIDIKNALLSALDNSDIVDILSKTESISISCKVTDITDVGNDITTKPDITDLQAFIRAIDSDYQGVYNCIDFTALDDVITVSLSSSDITGIIENEQYNDINFYIKVDGLNVGEKAGYSFEITEATITGDFNDEDVIEDPDNEEEYIELTPNPNWTVNNFTLTEDAYSPGKLSNIIIDLIDYEEPNSPDLSRYSKIEVEYNITSANVISNVFFYYLVGENWDYFTSEETNAIDGIISMNIPAGLIVNRLGFRAAFDSDYYTIDDKGEEVNVGLTITSVKLYKKASDNPINDNPTEENNNNTSNSNNNYTPPNESDIAAASEKSKEASSGYITSDGAFRAVTGINNGTVKIDAEKTGGITTDILTALAGKSQRKDVNITAKYSGFNVTISNKSITDKSKLESLDFSTGKSPVTESVKKSFPEASLIKGISFNNKGEFNGIDSVKISVKLDKSLINQKVTVYSMEGGKLVKIGVTFVNANGQANVEISNYNPLIFVVE